MIEIKVGEFVQKHIQKIIQECVKNPSLLNKLSDIEYSKKEFGIQWKELSFLKKTSEIEEQYDDRFWTKQYMIGNIDYRFFSQYGGNKLVEGKNYSEYHGLKILSSFISHGLLLDEFIGQDIKFIIGSSKNNLIHKIETKTVSVLKLNQIFYGPPGTGKTYNTINRALEIIDGKVPETRIQAKARFEELSKAGQIEFVTFHQSYGYEEFVEGIKANTVDGQISYDVEDGIFKRLCRKAKNNLFLLGQNIGKYQVVGVNSELLKLKRESGSIIPIPMYILNEVFDLIDKEIITTEDLNNKMAFEKMSISTEKFIINGYPNVFRDLAQYYKDNKNLERGNHENYILIIDEINRGNISKIFGELITLIEPSKRIGTDEEIRLRLPYSNDKFGVPSNLYIIGTMNTADRSIALMDTALRRRFEFIEMMPNTELLDFEVEGVNIKALVNKINTRVEYLYDRDHTIGHAYFVELNGKSSISDLNTVMRNKIIPLLQEYFYDDWEKIKLVLNEGFIERTKLKTHEIFDDIDDEYIEEDKSVYNICNEFLKESYLKLCQNR